jgi:hypothetical protein
VTGGDPVLLVGHTFLILSAFAVTAFIVIYSHAPWDRTPLGRVMMGRSAAFALVMWLQVIIIFALNEQNRVFLEYVYAIFQVNLFIASFALTYKLWRIRRSARGRKDIMTSSKPSSSLVSNRTYDVLKTVTTIVLPGISTLYFTLAQIWGFPYAEQVVGTIAAFNVFLGLFVKVSSTSYQSSDERFAGEIQVTHNDGGGKTANLIVNGDPEDLLKQSEATFKIS